MLFEGAVYKVVTNELPLIVITLYMTLEELKVLVPMKINCWFRCVILIVSDM